MGPTWFLSGTALAPCGLPLWSPDGFANYFGVSPTLFRYGGRMDPSGTIWAHMGYHYGTHIGFANVFDMGPTWI